MFTYASLIFAVLQSFATLADSAYTPCTTNCFNEASADQLGNMTLRLYNGSIDQYTEFPIGRAADFMDAIDESKPTVVYINGWTQQYQDPGSTTSIINAYLSLGYSNVVLLNWSKISNGEYTFVARSLEGVGFCLANTLNELVALGLDETGLSLVGHSFGAQISGFTGRYANFTMERITGLDPWGPAGFYVPIKHLASGDAKFVVMIHTDRNIFTLNLEPGDADFYPNNGVRPQPGCTTFDLCSHYRSCYYYAESVTNRTSLCGRKCNSYFEFVAGLCSSNERTEMGYYTPITAKGKYYLQTNDKSPYGRGINGTTYNFPSFFPG